MRPLALVFAAVWCVPALAGSVETGPGGVTVEDLVKTGMAQSSVANAIDAIGARLLGTPYVLGNAGEGPLDVFDEDPLWRLDEQDCTTYVETVSALARARDRAEFLHALAEIRYKDGVISFHTRNHFPETDWLPNNERKGYVRDVTEELFPSLARTTTVTIDKARWYGSMTEKNIEPVSRPLEERQKLAAVLRAGASQYAPEAATIPFLPMQNFFVKGANGELEPNKVVLSKIPNATLFNVVREGWAPGGLSLAISHQGFVIQKPDGTYMRHASEGRTVVEDRLDLYFARFLDSPTIRGLNLLEVTGVPPAPSRAE
jgi:hypothetical protein